MNYRSLPITLVTRTKFVSLGKLAIVFDFEYALMIVILDEGGWLILF